MFACEHANIKPDIMTLEKGLTGGYMTMAAMITSKNVSEVISNSEIGVFDAWTNIYGKSIGM